MQKTIFVALLFSASVAIGCSSNNDNNNGPDPTGNWDVTLTFTADSTCNGLPSTFDINFDITEAASGDFTFTAEAGLNGDTTSGQIACTADTCELAFSDTGSATEGLQNVDTQTITATFDEDNNDQVIDNSAATNQIDFALSDGTMCTAPFTATGDVAH